MNEDALTIFAVDKPRTIRNLKKKLTEELGAWEKSLRTAHDWAQFNRTLGTIEGLELALNVLNEIDKQDQN